MIRFFKIWLIFTVLGGFLEYLNLWILQEPDSGFPYPISRFIYHFAYLLAPCFVVLLVYLWNLENVAEESERYIQLGIEDVVDPTTMSDIYTPEGIARIAIKCSMFFALKFLVVSFLNRRIEKKSK